MGQFEIIFSLLLGIFALLIVYRGIPVIIKVARAKQLLDLPINERKIHLVGVPALGGVVFTAAIWFAFSLHPASETLKGYSTLLSSSIVLFIVGLKDDLFVMDPFKKLMAQVCSSLFLILGGNIYIESFGGVFGIGLISFPVSVGITLFSMVVVINAVNLIDGVDGLAGTLSAMSALFFGSWFWQADLYGEAVFATIFLFAMCGFLIHNWEHATIFMGDTGAMLSGLYLSVLGIQFLNSALSLPQIVFWQPAAPVLLVAVLMVPLYDTLRVFMLRVVNGSSPFHADAQHVHHQLLNMGFSHQKVTLTLAGFQLTILGSAILLSAFLEINTLLVSVLGISILFFPPFSFKQRVLAKISFVFSEKNGSIAAKDRKMERAEAVEVDQDPFECAKNEPDNVEVLNSKLGLNGKIKRSIKLFL